MRNGFFIVLMAVIMFGTSYWYFVVGAICSVPMEYRIGSVDSRFNISTDEVKNAVRAAESMWEDASGRNLFEYADDGKLTVNFVYDERQEYANEEESLRETLENKESMSESVRAQYETLFAKYGDLKKSYEARTATYERNLSAYNAEVAEWNAKGGAPQDVFERLKTTEKSLAKEQTQLNTVASELNNLVQKMNAISAKGNTLITDYNEVVNEYNNRFTEGHEFTQGDYETKTINIYQYDSKDELDIVLAHELGHALSLDHVEGETSVMYHLMEKQSKTIGVTDNDVTELIRVCGDGKSSFDFLRRTMHTLFE